MSHSKRWAWIIAECRHWLSTERPSTYSYVQRQAKIYFPKAKRRQTDRANLITLTVIRVMRVRYNEQWFEIAKRADGIFGAPRHTKNLGQIAWDIALGVKNNPRFNWKMRS